MGLTGGAAPALPTAPPHIWTLEDRRCPCVTRETTGWGFPLPSEASPDSHVSQSRCAAVKASREIFESYHPVIQDREGQRQGEM